MKFCSISLSISIESNLSFPDSPVNPVALFELYLEKLNPKNDHLWQCPKVLKTGIEDVWFDNQVVGKNTLNNVMKQLSLDAHLSRVYTNHCLKATAITNLDGKFENRHIMVVSHHTSEQTIKSYSTHCPTEKKREMFQELASKVPRMEKEQPQQQNFQELPTFELVALEELNIPQDTNVNVLNPPVIPIIQEPEINSENALVPAQENNIVAQPNLAMQAPPPNTTMQTIPQGFQNNMNIVQNTMNRFLLPMMNFHAPVTINYNFNMSQK